MSSSYWKRLVTNRLVPFRRNESGAALVEFALILPIMLLCLFGAINWGQTLHINGTMYDAARQAARQLAVGSADEAGALETANAILASVYGDYTVVAEDVNSSGSLDVRVTVSGDNPMATALPFVPSPSTLSAVVVMRKELD